MATSFGTTASASASAAAAASINPPNSSNFLPPFRRHYSHSRSKLKLRFSSSKGLNSNWKHSVVAKAQLHKDSVDGSSNAAPDTPPASETPAAVLASEESISEFISQVSSLVKLVDSSDIAELRLKQFDCELLIRKKEALLQPPSAPPHPPHTPPVQSHNMPAISPPAPAPAPAPPPKMAKPSESSFPPLECPMAGTFYRSPAPGEPPFVKAGDKVQKGQVLCIIEAMKLMNEIESNQSGTIVEILAKDGKPVTIGDPLFVIKPQ